MLIIATIVALTCVLISTTNLFDYVMNIDNDDENLGDHLRDMSLGHCPHCDEHHPECCNSDAFWTTFTCPRCGYHTRIHIKSN